MWIRVWKKKIKITDTTPTYNEIVKLHLIACSTANNVKIVETPMLSLSITQSNASPKLRFTLNDALRKFVDNS